MFQWYDLEVRLLPGEEKLSSKRLKFKIIFGVVVQ